MATEDKSDEALVMRALSDELRRSYQAVIEEPLPERMFALALELTLAEALRTPDETDPPGEPESPT